MIKTALFAAAAALATVVTAAPALAGEVAVSYADLDLSNAKDQATLNQRIARAARKVCEFSREDRIRSVDAMRCYKQARTRAHAEMAALVDNTRLGG